MQAGYPPQHDVVSGEQYRYALTNFRIAHEKVEQQRLQLEEQERQVALLRARINLLEGGDDGAAGYKAGQRQGGSTVDDFSIKNAATQLEKLIHRWAADVIQQPNLSVPDIRNAALSDILGGYDPDDLLEPPQDNPMQVQNLLRHVASETVSEAIINCLIVTNSNEANIQLARIHEHIFARDPTVACVWRRQTFSAAVEQFSPELSAFILGEHMPAILNLLSPDGKNPAPVLLQILAQAYAFSRMLHGARSSAGGTVDAFYRAFVPELGAPLNPRQVELVKRCMFTERHQADRVGAAIFPGLVKVTRGANGANEEIIVRRAQVICECALGISSAGYVHANGHA